MSPFLKRSERKPTNDAWRPDVSGGDEVYRELVLRWQGPIYSLARRMLRNEADAADATQEIFAARFDVLHPYYG